MNKEKKGFLIVIEGIDGSGKSTLAHGLCKKIAESKRPVLQTKEPGGTSVGLQLRELLVGEKRQLTPKAEYLLFATDHAQHIQEVVIPHLQSGYVVISDRMSDSCFAYQGYGRKIDTGLILDVNNWIMKDVAINITIYVRIPIHIALERVHKRGATTIFEQEAFLNRVTEGFEALYHNRTDVIIVDGRASQETLLATVYKELQSRFPDYAL